MLADQPLDGSHAREEVGLARHDRRAKRSRRGHLDRRGIGRHNDGGRHAERGGRICDSVGVIATRVSHHSTAALLRRQRAYRGVRTAKFERPGWLQRLSFDEYALPANTQWYQGCAQSDAAKAISCRLDLIHRHKV